LTEAGAGLRKDKRLELRSSRTERKDEERQQVVTRGLDFLDGSCEMWVRGKKKEKWSEIRGVRLFLR